MEIQVINLSLNDVFREFSKEYKIYRDVYQPGLLSVEIRGLDDEQAKSIQTIVLNANEICYRSDRQSNGQCNLFIPGTFRRLNEIAGMVLKNCNDDVGYKLNSTIKNYEGYEHRAYKFGSKIFSFDKCYLMGILNVTPDSFSDGGKYLNADSAVDHAVEMLDDGADIIDIGAESTRPGSESVPADEEIKRLLPVIDSLLKKRPDTIISVDTTKNKVAEKALAHGVKIINDVSAFNFDPEIISSVKRYKAGYVLMHMLGTPKNMQEKPEYDNLVKDIYDFLYEKLQILVKCGIKETFIDPGIGFGKSVENNFELLKRLDDFKSLGSPILIGVSRKSFIGKTLNLEVDQRDAATAAIEAVAVKNGAKIIRTHNVKYGAQICKLLGHL